MTKYEKYDRQRYPNNDLLAFDSNDFTNIYLYAIMPRKELKLPVFVSPVQVSFLITTNKSTLLIVQIDK